MKIEVFSIGIMAANSYLVSNEETKEALFIDLGDCPDSLVDHIREEQLTIRAILLTHAHFDHIMGIKKFEETFPVPVYVEAEDLPMMEDPVLNESTSYMAGGYSYEGATPVKDGDVLSLIGQDFLVLHTPGHSPGSCCYYVAEEGVLFSGDTLFAESVGRSDFAGGDEQALLTGIREKLLTLPEETHVYPGHMGETTIGHEKQYNPFVGVRGIR